MSSAVAPGPSSQRHDLPLATSALAHLTGLLHVSTIHSRQGLVIDDRPRWYWLLGIPLPYFTSAQFHILSLIFKRMHPVASSPG